MMMTMIRMRIGMRMSFIMMFAIFHSCSLVVAVVVGVIRYDLK